MIIRGQRLIASFLHPEFMRQFQSYFKNTYLVLYSFQTQFRLSLLGSLSSLGSYALVVMDRKSWPWTGISDVFVSPGWQDLRYHGRLASLRWRDWCVQGTRQEAEPGPGLMARSPSRGKD